MSEYIDIQHETTDDPAVMLLRTNLNLTPEGGPEIYPDRDSGEEGSPLAQALFYIPGLAALTMDDAELLVARGPDVEWHDLIEDVTDALRDFFL